MLFIPVAVKTLEALGVDVTDFVRQLNRLIVTVTGKRKFIPQRLSVVIQRSNAATVSGTVGLEASRLDAVFYL